MPAHLSDGDTPARATEATAPTTEQARGHAPAAATHQAAHAGAGHVSHGNTQDAWTGVVILLLGALIACFGVVFDTTWIWVLGAVICLAGVVAWIGMHRAGMTKELW